MAGPTCTHVTTSSLRSRNRIIARLHGGVTWAHVSPLCTTISESMSTRFMFYLRFACFQTPPADIRIGFSRTVLVFKQRRPMPVRLASQL